MFGLDLPSFASSLRSGWQELVGAMAPESLRSGPAWWGSVQAPPRSSSGFADWRQSSVPEQSTAYLADWRQALRRPNQGVTAQASPTGAIANWFNWRGNTKQGLPAAISQLPVQKPIVGPPPQSPVIAQARDSGDVNRIVGSLSDYYGVPEKLIMMAESGGDPGAEGDWTGGTKGVGTPQSIGLFQLHEKGVGSGMSVQERKDAYTNAARAIPLVAAAYQASVDAGLWNEALVRAVYDRAINPGAASLSQGDSVWDWYRRIE